MTEKEKTKKEKEEDLRKKLIIQNPDLPSWIYWVNINKKR